MKKIMILGAGGSGKSTLSEYLSSLLNIKNYHLDKLYWDNNIRIPNEKLQSKIEEIITKESWILDGHYGGLYDIRFQKADTIIFLMMPVYLCLYRILKRRFNQIFNKSKNYDCNIPLNFKFLKWVFKFNFTDGKNVCLFLNKYTYDKNILIFKTKKQLQLWLNNINKGEI